MTKLLAAALASAALMTPVTVLAQGYDGSPRYAQAVPNIQGQKAADWLYQSPASSPVIERRDVPYTGTVVERPRRSIDRSGRTAR